MADEDNGNGKKPQDLTLTITLTGTKVNVTGFIANEPLALWALDKAKDIIKAFNMQEMIKNQPRVVSAQGGIMNFVRSKRN